LKDRAAIAEHQIVLPVTVEVTHSHRKSFGKIRGHGLEISIPLVQEGGRWTEDVSLSVAREVADDKIAADS
jgi:hypothetical protein